MSNEFGRPLVSETPFIRIKDLAPAIKRILANHEMAVGTLDVFGDTEDLKIAVTKGQVQAKLGDQTVGIDGVPSNLQPGTIGRWYFVCPQCGNRTTRLYRPSLEQPFACRRCHHLEYRSRLENNRKLYEAVGEMVGLDWRLVRDLTKLFTGDA